MALCTECGGDICAACHGSDLRGYCICASCREKYAPPTTPWEDPRVDYSPGAFGRTLRDVLTAPQSFFRTVRFSGSVAPAVVFGLICLSLGLVFSTTWRMFLVDPQQLQEFIKQLGEVTHQVGLTVHMVKVVSFVVIPLRVALIFGIHTAAVHLGVKLAGKRSTLGLSARIVGYASAAYIFLLLPPIAGFAVGPFLAIIWLFNLQVGALRTYFNLSVGRTILVTVATLMLVIVFAGRW